MAMITADPQDVPKVGSFSFTPDSMAKVKELIANYPPGRQASAVIGVLQVAERQFGWLPRVAMDWMNRGHMLADVSAILGSLDIVFGEIDR